LAGPLSESALQARYQQVRDSLAEKQFGYITVPDQGTAQTILGQLTANPAVYPSIAARYPGSYTLPALEARTAQEIPSAFASAVAGAAPNSGFVQAVAQVGVVVVFVGTTVYPTYDEARGQLQQQAASEVDTQAQKLVDKVRNGLNVQVNPRYGVLKNGAVSEPTGGAVDILGSATGSSTGPSTGSSTGSATGSGTGAATATPGG
jgi:peptidyl-prolyl cis-trans isomerase SurA